MKLLKIKTEPNKKRNINSTKSKIPLKINNNNSKADKDCPLILDKCE